MAGNQRTSSGQITLTRALRAFVATDVAGGVVLVVAAVRSSAWSRSSSSARSPKEPDRGVYRQLWEVLRARLGSNGSR
jgi:hypothetical protein